jgi:hypothetical protein
MFPLVQPGTEDEHHTAFASRILNAAECNYATEGEGWFYNYTTAHSVT